MCRCVQVPVYGDDVVDYVSPGQKIEGESMVDGRGAEESLWRSVVCGGLTAAVWWVTQAPPSPPLNPPPPRPSPPPEPCGSIATEGGNEVTGTREPLRDLDS